MTHKFDALDTSQVFVWWFWCSALRGWSWFSSVFFIFPSSLFSSSLLLLGNIWRWIGRLASGIESFIRCWFHLTLLRDWTHLVRSMILLWFVMFWGNFADYCLRLTRVKSKFTTKFSLVKMSQKNMSDDTNHCNTYHENCDQI